MQGKTLILMTSLMLALTSCSQGEEPNVKIVVSSQPQYLIPDSASSCLARKNAGADPPSRDVEASYFKIPTFAFTRKNSDQLLIISLIRVKVELPSAETITCIFSGDSLSALDSSWWGQTESIIPAGTASFETDCSAICGGISAQGIFSTTATVEVLGYEKVSAELNSAETPFRTETTMQVQSAF